MTQIPDIEQFKPWFLALSADEQKELAKHYFQAVDWFKTQGLRTNYRQVEVVATLDETRITSFQVNSKSNVRFHHDSLNRMVSWKHNKDFVLGDLDPKLHDLIISGEIVKSDGTSTLRLRKANIKKVPKKTLGQAPVAYLNFGTPTAG